MFGMFSEDDAKSSIEMTKDINSAGDVSFEAGGKT